MRIRLLLTLALSLCTAHAFAQIDVTQLQRLIETGRADEAYRQALPYRSALEGDPVFDFHYGWAAVDSGHLDEGVFALSRVVMQQPRNARARLELARAYYLLGEDTRARQEFEAVLDQGPPSAVRTTVQRFLDAITTREASYRAHGSAYVQVSVGYDTNINSAPAEDPYAFLGIKTDWASEHPSAFGQVDAGGQYTLPFSRDSAWFARADATWRGHEDGSRFNNGNITAQGGLTHKRDQHRYKLALIGQNYVVEDESFRTLFGVSGEWNRLVRQDFLYGASITLAQLGYPDQSHRDGSLLNLGVNAVGTTGRGLWFTSGFLGREQADDDTEWTDASVSRTFGGARAGLQWPMGKTTATASALLQFSQYDGKRIWLEENFDEVRREDTYAALDLELKRALGQRLSVVTHLGFADNQSTVASYDYQRTQVRVGLRYER